jgi:hypothetical protein
VNHFDMPASKLATLRNANTEITDAHCQSPFAERVHQPDFCQIATHGGNCYRRSALFDKRWIIFQSDGGFVSGVAWTSDDETITMPARKFSSARSGCTQFVFG